MKRSIKLGSKVISDDTESYFIAEIGVNHEGSIEKAKELIELAKEGGADAAKFQTYKAHKLTAKESPSYWDLSKEPTASQRKLFEKYDGFNEEEYVQLAEYCKKVGIDFLSTPFDDQAIEWLNPLVPFFKIASADITSFPFLKKIAGKGKPVVLSTGASTMEEIRSALGVLGNSGCRETALLHCILNYPTPYRSANLNMIEDLRENFQNCVIGYSDHTYPDQQMAVLTTAHLKGARIIEKHFTFDKTLKGNDHFHSLDKEDLLKFKSHLRFIRELEGEKEKRAIESEQISRQNARRSLVLNKSIRNGERLTQEHLTYKRPGTGISPTQWDEVIGLKVNRDLDADTILQWSYLDRS